MSTPTLRNGRRIRTEPRPHRKQGSRMRLAQRNAEHEEILRDPTKAD